MQNINVKSIRWENVRAIFHAVANAEKISRADISADTDLSLMTVGKVADALLDLGIVRQTKETRNAAGRRAGILSLHPDYYAMVLDLTEHGFSFSAIGANLKTHKEFPHSFNSNFTYEENLSLFLKAAQAYIHSNDKNVCMGIGVALPAPLDSASGYLRTDARSPLYRIPIASLVHQFFPALRVQFEDAIHAAAASNVFEIEDHADTMILYCFAADGTVRGAIAEGGRILRGAHGAAGNFGEMALSRGRTLASAIRKDNPIADNAAEIARMLHNVILTTDPDTVAFESDLPGSTNVFIDLLKTELCAHYGYAEDTLPRFTYCQCPYRHAHRGLALRIREEYLYRAVFGEEDDLQ